MTSWMVFVSLRKTNIVKIETMHVLLDRIQIEPACKHIPRSTSSSDALTTRVCSSKTEF